MTSKDKNISRRTFLKLFGAGTVATATALAGCKEGVVIGLWYDATADESG